ncbi:hypothetical protein PVBG_05197 [Plasmodium vivax Brazil I]|uniref:PIR Superfamily Protein n=1 Tax=Plasmodium vivax (strain Brazil I) TaxID=1033975 RepID=A0A0J9SMJ1_PLAV1|nr:hypothetical protein PVBG_05197 [Plasmodium vivax Brazil I]
MIIALYKVYPFLKNPWESYEEFEKSVEKNDDPSGFSESTCQFIIMSTVKNISKYKNFCKKLTRNLGAYSTDQRIINPRPERCKNINSWLNYLIMKYNIPNNFIQKCFKESKPPVINGVKSNICTYYPYEKDINEEHMLKITIFVDNISTILDILKDKTHEHNCLGRKFLYECSNIYKKINKDYCSNGESSDTKNICSKLDDFRTNYNAFIPSISNIPENIKSLNAEVVEFTDVCPLNESELKLASDVVNRTGSSGTSSTTTAVGTVAGVSSALALLYKVQRIFHSNI